MGRDRVGKDSVNVRMCVWVMVEVVDRVVGEVRGVVSKEVVRVVERMKDMVECKEVKRW